MSLATFGAEIAKGTRDIISSGRREITGALGRWFGRASVKSGERGFSRRNSIVQPETFPPGGDARALNEEVTTTSPYSNNDLFLYSQSLTDEHLLFSMNNTVPEEVEAMILKVYINEFYDDLVEYLDGSTEDQADILFVKFDPSSTWANKFRGTKNENEDYDAGVFDFSVWPNDQLTLGGLKIVLREWFSCGYGLNSCETRNALQDQTFTTTTTTTTTVVSSSDQVTGTVSTSGPELSSTLDPDYRDELATYFTYDTEMNQSELYRSAVLSQVFQNLAEYLDRFGDQLDSSGQPRRLERFLDFDPSSTWANLLRGTIDASGKYANGIYDFNVSPNADIDLDTLYDLLKEAFLCTESCTDYNTFQPERTTTTTTTTTTTPGSTVRKTSRRYVSTTTTAPDSGDDSYGSYYSYYSQTTSSTATEISPQEFSSAQTVAQFTDHSQESTELSRTKAFTDAVTSVFGGTGSRLHTGFYTSRDDSVTTVSPAFRTQAGTTATLYAVSRSSDGLTYSATMPVSTGVVSLTVTDPKGTVISKNTMGVTTVAAAQSTETLSTAIQSLSESTDMLSTALQFLAETTVSSSSGSTTPATTAAAWSRVTETVSTVFGEVSEALTQLSTAQSRYMSSDASSEADTTAFAETTAAVITTIHRQLDTLETTLSQSSTGDMDTTAFLDGLSTAVQDIKSTLEHSIEASSTGATSGSQATTVAVKPTTVEAVSTLLSTLQTTFDRMTSVASTMTASRQLSSAVTASTQSFSELSTALTTFSDSAQLSTEFGRSRSTTTASSAATTVAVSALSTSHGLTEAVTALSEALTRVQSTDNPSVADTTAFAQTTASVLTTVRDQLDSFQSTLSESVTAGVDMTALTTGLSSLSQELESSIAESTVYATTGAPSDTTVSRQATTMTGMTTVLSAVETTLSRFTPLLTTLTDSLQLSTAVTRSSQSLSALSSTLTTLAEASTVDSQTTSSSPNSVTELATSASQIVSDALTDLTEVRDQFLSTAEPTVSDTTAFLQTTVGVFTSIDQQLSTLESHFSGATGAAVDTTALSQSLSAARKEIQTTMDSISVASTEVTTLAANFTQSRSESAVTSMATRAVTEAVRTIETSVDDVSSSLEAYTRTVQVSGTARATVSAMQRLTSHMTALLGTTTVSSTEGPSLSSSALESLTESFSQTQAALSRATDRYVSSTDAPYEASTAFMNETQSVVSTMRSILSEIETTISEYPGTKGVSTALMWAQSTLSQTEESLSANSTTNMTTVSPYSSYVTRSQGIQTSMALTEVSTSLNLVTSAVIAARSTALLDEVPSTSGQETSQLDSSLDPFSTTSGAVSRTFGTGTTATRVFFSDQATNPPKIATQFITEFEGCCVVTNMTCDLERGLTESEQAVVLAHCLQLSNTGLCGYELLSEACRAANITQVVTNSTRQQTTLPGVTGNAKTEVQYTTLTSGHSTGTVRNETGCVDVVFDGISPTAGEGTRILDECSNWDFRNFSTGNCPPCVTVSQADYGRCFSTTINGTELIVRVDNQGNKSCEVDGVLYSIDPSQDLDTELPTILGSVFAVVVMLTALAVVVSCICGRRPTDKGCAKRFLFDAVEDAFGEESVMYTEIPRRPWCIDRSCKFVPKSGEYLSAKQQSWMLIDKDVRQSYLHADFRNEFAAEHWDTATFQLVYSLMEHGLEQDFLDAMSHLREGDYLDGKSPLSHSPFAFEKEFPKMDTRIQALFASLSTANVFDRRHSKVPVGESLHVVVRDLITIESLFVKGYIKNPFPHSTRGRASSISSSRSASYRSQRSETSADSGIELSEPSSKVMKKKVERIRGRLMAVQTRYLNKLKGLFDWAVEKRGGNSVEVLHNPDVFAELTVSDVNRWFRALMSKNVARRKSVAVSTLNVLKLKKSSPDSKEAEAAEQGLHDKMNKRFTDMVKAVAFRWVRAIALDIHSERTDRNKVKKSAILLQKIRVLLAVLDNLKQYVTQVSERESSPVEIGKEESEIFDLLFDYQKWNPSFEVDYAMIKVFKRLKDVYALSQEDDDAKWPQFCCFLEPDRFTRFLLRVPDELRMISQELLKSSRLRPDDYLELYYSKIWPEDVKETLEKCVEHALMRQAQSRSALGMHYEPLGAYVGESFVHDMVLGVKGSEEELFSEANLTLVSRAVKKLSGQGRKSRTEPCVRDAVFDGVKPGRDSVFRLYFFLFKDAYEKRVGMSLDAAFDELFEEEPSGSELAVFFETCGMLEDGDSELSGSLLRQPMGLAPARVLAAFFAGGTSVEKEACIGLVSAHSGALKAADRGFLSRSYASNTRWLAQASLKFLKSLIRDDGDIVKFTKPEGAVRDDIVRFSTRHIRLFAKAIGARLRSVRNEHGYVDLHLDLMLLAVIGVPQEASHKLFADLLAKEGLLKTALIDVIKGRNTRPASYVSFFIMRAVSYIQLLPVRDLRAMNRGAATSFDAHLDVQQKQQLQVIVLLSFLAKFCSPGTVTLPFKLSDYSDLEAYVAKEVGSVEVDEVVISVAPSPKSGVSEEDQAVSLAEVSTLLDETKTDEDLTALMAHKAQIERIIFNSEEESKYGEADNRALEDFLRKGTSYIQRLSDVDIERLECGYDNDRLKVLLLVADVYGYKKSQRRAEDPEDAFLRCFSYDGARYPQLVQILNNHFAQGGMRDFSLESNPEGVIGHFRPASAIPKNSRRFKAFMKERVGLEESSMITDQGERSRELPSPIPFIDSPSSATRSFSAASRSVLLALRALRGEDRPEDQSMKVQPVQQRRPSLSAATGDGYGKGPSLPDAVGMDDAGASLRAKTRTPRRGSRGSVERLPSDRWRAAVRQHLTPDRGSHFMMSPVLSNDASLSDVVWTVLEQSRYQSPEAQIGNPDTGFGKVVDSLQNCIRFRGMKSYGRCVKGVKAVVMHNAKVASPMISFMERFREATDEGDGSALVNLGERLQNLPFQDYVSVMNFLNRNRSGFTEFQQGLIRSLESGDLSRVNRKAGALTGLSEYRLAYKQQKAMKEWVWREFCTLFSISKSDEGALVFKYGKGDAYRYRRQGKEDLLNVFATEIEKLVAVEVQLKELPDGRGRTDARLPLDKEKETVRLSVENRLQTYVTVQSKPGKGGKTEFHVNLRPLIKSKK